MLDRFKTDDGKGKYAIINLRRLCKDGNPDVANAVVVLEEAGHIDYGTSPETSFFVFRSTDKYAIHALSGYHNALVAAILACNGNFEKQSLREKLSQYTKSVAELIGSWLSLGNKKDPSLQLSITEDDHEC
jgi:hypothetical protein